MQKRSPNHSQGVDVSHWQGDINWQKVADAGKRFVFIKATEGEGWTDPKWKDHALGASKAGLSIGFYHFARFKNRAEAVREARHFVQTIDAMPSALPHVLDLEVTNGLSKVELSELALFFLENVKKWTDHEVMLYTNANMAANHLTSILQHVPLWIAHYGTDQPRPNKIWKKWRVFQYSNRGRVPGIRGFVDLDEMVPEVSDEPHTYTIQAGDTFWDLERKNGWAHGTLQKLNPRVNPRRLQIGQSIRIP